MSQWSDTQAIYLFGSFIELPFSDAAVDLSDHFGLPVDLVNRRQASTVFANRIISTGERILKDEELPVEEFEMLNLSFYQKLNAERHDILEAFFETGRAVKL